jgi:hypothetical protein
MIAIRTATGNLLDLPQGKIMMELNFPGLDLESIKQSFAFSSTFPSTPINDREFGHGRFLNVPKKIREISVFVELGGNLWRPGVIIFLELGDDGYNGSIVLDELFVDQIDRSLKEIDFGSPISIGETPEERVAHAKAKSEIHGYQSQSNPYTFFPVYNPWFYGGALSGEDGFGEGSNPDFDKFINEFNAITFSPPGRTFLHNVIPIDDSPMNRRCLVPFLYHHYILEKIFEPYGVQLGGTFWNDQECRTSILWNNHPLDYKRRRRFLQASIDTGDGYNQLVSFKVLNLNLSGPNDQDEDSRFNDSTNKYYTGNIGEFRVRIEGTAQGFHNTTDEPKNCFGDILIRVVGTGYDESYVIVPDTDFIVPGAGGSFSGEYIFNLPDGAGVSDIYLEARCITSEGLIRFTSGFVTIENFRASDLNEFSPEINPANHVPDAQISTYLNELRKLFGFTFIFDPITRALNLDFVTDFLGPQSSDPLEIATSGKLKFKLRERNSLLYKFDFSSSEDELVEENFKSLDGLNYRGIATDVPNPQEGDCTLIPHAGIVQVYSKGKFQYFTDYFPEQRYGTDKNVKEISLSMTPMFMRIAVYGASKLTIPAIKQEANSPAFNQDNAISSFKTCFYRGYILGLEPDAPTRLVPTGSSFAFGQWGQQIGQTVLSLQDVNAPGIYKYHKSLIDLLLYSDFLTTKVKLSLDQIFELSWKRRWMTMGVYLIPTKLTFLTDSNSISETEAELYTDFSGYDTES